MMLGKQKATVGAQKELVKEFQENCSYNLDRLANSKAVKEFSKYTMGK